MNLAGLGLIRELESKQHCPLGKQTHHANLVKEMSLAVGLGNQGIWSVLGGGDEG